MVALNLPIKDVFHYNDKILKFLPNKLRVLGRWGYFDDRNGGLIILQKWWYKKNCEAHLKMGDEHPLHTV